MIDMDSERIPTAEALCAYRKELLAGGMPDEMVETLVLDAGHRLHEYGLALADAPDCVGAGRVSDPAS